MKILAAGDIHGDQRQSNRLAKKAEKEGVDLVILSGDLTMAESSVDGLIGPFRKVGKRVVLIPGNHETIATADFLANLYGMKNLHGYSMEIGDLGIFGCGSANIGLFQLSEKEIYDLLKKGFDEVKNRSKKIMVTHVHPDRTLMEKLTNIFPGSSAVSRAIKKFEPDIAICSHVHEAEGIEEQIGKTKLINVGKEGKIIEI
ncbi:MAG: metallophosphoesterase [Candidatus Woesearchaeota archaeon]|nr:MAG: metallophosphoesterase [Candidatus Woesearchaeota archaeon]